MRKLVLTAIACLLSSSLSIAQDATNIRKSLESLKGKTLVLRNAYLGNSLVFTHNGELKGTAEPVTVPLFGVLAVNSIAVRPRSIEIKAEKVVLFIDRSQADMQEVRLGERQTVSIESDTEIDSVKKAEDLIAAIFHPPDYLDRLRSGYWEPRVASPQEMLAAAPMGQSIGLLNGREVYLPRPGGVVSPPKPIYRPNPKYSEEARRMKIKGISVWTLYLNEKGQPELIELVRSLEPTLDAQAVQVLRTWRFEPATKDARPVAVKLTVSLTFDLY